MVDYGITVSYPTSNNLKTPGVLGWSYMSVALTNGAQV